MSREYLRSQERNGAPQKELIVVFLFHLIVSPSCEQYGYLGHTEPVSERVPSCLSGHINQALLINRDFDAEPEKADERCGSDLFKGVSEDKGPQAQSVQRDFQFCVDPNRDQHRD